MSYPKNAWVENTPVGGVKGGNFEIVASAGAGKSLFQFRPFHCFVRLLQKFNAALYFLY
jgi:hypothetical protein